MVRNMRRNLSGSFLATKTAQGRWRLVRRETPELELYLKGIDAHTVGDFGASPISNIDVEWGNGTATLYWISAARPRAVAAQSAIMHEALPRLYDALPLASFDTKARRFWRRVFFLVRIPGGRRLLHALARHSRVPE
jgi:hypothetical protein